METLLALVDRRDILDYLSIEDFQSLSSTNTALKNTRSPTLSHYFYKKFGSKPRDAITAEMIYFGFRYPPQEYTPELVKGWYYFLHFCPDGIQKRNFYYRWWDRYLTFFFNYQKFSNFFFYSTSTGIGFKKDVLYFEITIVKPPPQDEFFSFGFCEWGHFIDMMEMKIMPGWFEGSVALHSDDGSVHCHGEKHNYVGNFGRGDTIGCGIELFPSPKIFFVINGLRLFRLKFTMKEMVYPCVVSTSGVLDLDMNFGSTPFVWQFLVG